MSLTSPIADSVVGLAFSASFERDGLCFAAGLLGLYRSADGGQAWERLLPGPDSEPASVLSVACAADGTLFAGTQGGVLRSVDLGNTWTMSTLPAPAPTVWALGISPGFPEDQTVFAGTAEDGVFMSLDGGATWTSWNFGLYDRNVLSLALSLHFASDYALFVGCNSDVFQSTTGGRSWESKGFPIDAAPVLSLAAVLGPGGERQVFAGTENDGLFVSIDGAETWHSAKLFAEPTGSSAPAGAINAISAKTIQPDNPAQPPESWLMVADEQCLHVSLNGARTWQTTLPIPDILCVASPPNLAETTSVLVGRAHAGVEWVALAP